MWVMEGDRFGECWNSCTFIYKALLQRVHGRAQITLTQNIKKVTETDDNRLLFPLDTASYGIIYGPIKMNVTFQEINENIN